LNRYAVAAQVQFESSFAPFGARSESITGILPWLLMDENTTYGFNFEA